MSCPEQSGEEAALRLMAFVDGELDEAGSATVREHLAVCAACREDAEMLGGLNDRIQGAFPERPRGAPEDAKARIRGALEGAMAATTPGTPPRARGLRIVRRAGGLAALAAAAVVVVGLVFGIFADPAAADLAKDHRMCIGMAPESAWAREPSKISAVLSRELGSEAVLLDLEAAGYERKGALVCTVHERRFVHLGFVAPGRAPASVYLAPAEARSLFVRAETLIRSESPVVVVSIEERPGVDCFLVSSPEDAPALARIVREQLARRRAQ